MPKSSRTDVLLVAATELELCGHEGLACGVGPVEAAAVTARALAETRPRAVLHVGIAGARRLTPGSIVVGTESVYLDLAAAIPSNPATETLPMLMVTGNGVSEDVVRALRCGFGGYIVKPFTEETLAQQLTSLLFVN